MESKTVRNTTSSFVTKIGTTKASASVGITDDTYSVIISYSPELNNTLIQFNNLSRTEALDLRELLEAIISQLPKKYETGGILTGQNLSDSFLKRNRNSPMIATNGQLDIDDYYNKVNVMGEDGNDFTRSA